MYIFRYTYTHACDFYCIKIKNSLRNYFIINILPFDPECNVKLCRFHKDFFGHSWESRKRILKAINFNYELAAMLCINLLYHFSYQTYYHRLWDRFFIFHCMYQAGGWLLISKYMSFSMMSNYWSFFFSFWDVIGNLTPSSTKEFLNIVFTFISYGKLGWNLGGNNSFPFTELCFWLEL